VVSQDDVRFYQETVLPECEFIASVLNEQVLEPLGYNLTFNKTDMEIFQADESERSGSLVNIAKVLENPMIFKIASKMLGYQFDEEVNQWVDELIADKETKAKEVAQQTQPMVTQPPVQPAMQQQQPPAVQAINPVVYKELDSWHEKCIRYIEREKPIEPFLAYAIPPNIKTQIDEKLKSAKTIEDINHIFEYTLVIDDTKNDHMRKAIEQLNTLLNKYVPAEAVVS